MNFKEPKNILEFIKFQKTVLRKFRIFVNKAISINYKKAAIFVYWLNDYISFLNEEERFNPSYNITYKRGQIVFVNFGYRIGRELGGNHYAVVLDVKNSRKSHTVTVVPLNSLKETETTYSKIYHVPLGDCVKTLLYEKSSDIRTFVKEELLKLAGEVSQYSSSELPKKKSDIYEKITSLSKQQKAAEQILCYTKKLKSESVANVGQILTISKQRIIHPCKSNDILTGIILSDELMSLIDDKIKKIYIGD